MKRIILWATVLTIIQSCCPKLYSRRTENIEHMVTVTETVRDTVVQIQPDSSIVQALIKCDSTGRARLEEIRTLKESARIHQHLSLMEIGYDSLTYAQHNSSGIRRHNAPISVLTLTSKVDSLGIYLQYKERYKEEQKAQTIETIIEKEVNVLKWWQKSLMALGLLFSIGICGKFLLKLMKTVW